jgi:L,D-peptidoglycan transpeptidase YkuD (ErfK/YbiS/YcfS/YnhG family)
VAAVTATAAAAAAAAAVTAAAAAIDADYVAAVFAPAEAAMAVETMLPVRQIATVVAAPAAKIASEAQAAAVHATCWIQPAGSLDVAADLEYFATAAELKDLHEFPVLCNLAAR